MPINLALQVVTWCVLLTSMTILWIGDMLPPWLAVAGYAVIIISALRLRSGAPPWLSARQWRWLTLAAMFWFLLEWIVLDQGLLTASLHLLLFLMVYKLLTLTGSRDYLHLYLVGFFQLLASTAAVAELPYGIIFSCYVVLSPWMLMLYTLQLEAEQQYTAGYAPVIRWPFFVMTTGTAIGTFVLTLAIFFILPRVGAGFVQHAAGSGEPVPLVGFSERVDLGTIGAIKQDPTVVMRVGLTMTATPSRQAFYWRGTAYDFYDGESWQNRRSGRMAVPRGPDGWFRLASMRNVASAALVRQEITLEPIASAIIFAAAPPLAVGGRLGGLRIDGQSTLLLPMVPASRIRYQVESALPRLAPADREATLADYQRLPEPYLQLPGGSERLQRLAREVVGLKADDTAPSGLPVLEQSRKIEVYLQKNYRYTLDVQPPRHLSAIDDFLFEQKAGYCEYYATAMTLMLRSIGIPARMVSGFMEGEWNEFGNYFTVRQQDAHTWVEVYFPASGWYPFDPTPSVEGGPALFTQLHQALDTLWVSWDRYIMRYNVRDQVAALQEMRAQGSTWQARSGRWVDQARAQGDLALQWLVRHREWGMLAAAAACFAFLAARSWAQRHGGWPFWSARSLQAAQRRGRTFYLRLLGLLAARGLKKPPAMTALEFSQWAAPRLGAVSPAVDTLTRHYHRLRFGGSELTIDEQVEVNRLLRQVARELKHQPRQPVGAGVGRPEDS